LLTAIKRLQGPEVIFVKEGQGPWVKKSKEYKDWKLKLKG